MAALRRATHAVTALGLAAAALVAAPAHAEPSARDRALSESLFREAKKRFEAGEVESACKTFAESQRLDPRVGTLLHLATCHEREGKLATAWIEFSDAEKQAAAAKQRDRAQLARAKVEELEERIPKLTVTLKGAPKGVVVTLDGQKLGEGGFDVPMPLDPGEHVVAATAEGRKPWSETVRLEADAPPRTVTVPELESDAPPPPPPVVLPPPAPVDHEGGRRRMTGYVVGGAGLASVALGAYVGVLMLQRKSSAETGCVGRLCTQAALDRFDEARTQGWLSTAFVGLGLAAVATGVVLVVTADRSPAAAPTGAGPLTPQAAPRLWVGPITGRGEAGLSLGGIL